MNPPVGCHVISLSASSHQEKAKEKKRKKEEPRCLNDPPSMVAMADSVVDINNHGASIKTIRRLYTGISTIIRAAGS